MPPDKPFRHSDIDGVNRDARAGAPNRDPAKGTAREKQEAEEQSIGRPKQSSDRP